MPNWCKGNIRLRGKPEDIVAFLSNEIVCCTHTFDSFDITEHRVKCEYQNDECTISKPPEIGERGWFYIAGTKRNFIEQAEICEFIEEPYPVCIDGFKAAWVVHPEPYIEKSKRYGIDIKIVTFERGMEFMQTVEVSRGKLILNEEKNFDDWLWECPMPNMGG